MNDKQIEDIAIWMIAFVAIVGLFAARFGSIKISILCLAGVVGLILIRPEKEKR